MDKKIYIFVAVVVFIGGAASSLVTRDLAETLLHFFGESVRPHIVGKSFFSLVLFIVSHNAVALLLIIFVGMILAIFPLLALYVNGLIVGAALLHSPMSWWQLLPHGIFEIPAILFAAAYGIWLGLWPFSKGKADGLRSRLRTCSITYIRLILPLLILAGVIESALISQIG
ncbi:MAG: stage II sporulation protein M [Desulfuromonadales bacterium]